MSYEPLDEKIIEARARAVGLERAWVQCHEDVIAAAREAARLGAALPPLDPDAEPWPSMSVPGAVSVSGHGECSSGADE